MIIASSIPAPDSVYLNLVEIGRAISFDLKKNKQVDEGRYV